jgi:hypothetical protein
MVFSKEITQKRKFKISNCIDEIGLNVASIDGVCGINFGFDDEDILDRTERLIIEII